MVEVEDDYYEEDFDYYDYVEPGEEYWYEDMMWDIKMMEEYEEEVE